MVHNQDHEQATCGLRDWLEQPTTQCRSLDLVGPMPARAVMGTV